MRFTRFWHKSSVDTRHPRADDCQRGSHRPLNVNTRGREEHQHTVASYKVTVKSPKTRRKTAIRFDPVNPAITVYNSRYLKPRMVYILRADKLIPYDEGRSRIVYIGETSRGTKRPAGSAASKARMAFKALHGVKRIDVHPLTFRGKQSVRLWEVLERDLLSTFKDVYGEIPCYNQQGKGKKFSTDRIKYFRPSRLRRIVALLS